MESKNSVQTSKNRCVGASESGGVGSTVDAAGRTVEIGVYGGDDREYESLVAMYASFDPASRAQGIPPLGESNVRDWLDDFLLVGEGVTARDGPTVVGHAVLVPRSAGGHELAVFVDADYRGAGVGSALLDALLAHGSDRGVEAVWLVVEASNRVAQSLYESAGFEVESRHGFEIEMRRSLPADARVG